MKRVWNFSPGPAVLPLSVIERAQEDIFSFEGCGVGVMELSHRSQEFEGILAKTEALLRECLSVPQNYQVLFMSGGGTNQFSIIPMNLQTPGGIGNYILSGFWAERALNEAKKFIPTHIAASTKESGYTSIPKDLALSENPAFLHYTTNNTIYGTQFKEPPRIPSDIPLIGDCSSDILSRPMDVSKYGLIYAAAQKNAGIAGVTLVILREDLLERSNDQIPLMMSYRVFAENKSLYNTAPTFSIYMTMRVLEWIKSEGGISEMSRRAEARAALLYSCIDRHPLYRGYADPESRSEMNVTFHLATPDRTEALIAEAEKRGLKTIKGYRTLGGIRVSLYNAMPLEGVQELVSFLDEFAS